MTDSVDIERRLRQINEQFKAKNPYEIFDLWPGCGRTLVQTRFYDLVKIHHPDSYGGNLSESIRQLAQENFIRVKDAYALLRGMESEQTQPNRPALDDELESEKQAKPQPAAGQSTPTQKRQPSRSEQPTRPVPNHRDHASVQDRAAALARLRSTKRAPSSYGLELDSEVIQPVTTSQRPQRTQQSTNANQDVDRKALLAKLASKRKAPPPKTAPRATTMPGVPIAAADAVVSEANEVKSWFADGYQLFKSGQNIRAYELLKKAFEAQPDNAIYRTVYGRVLFLVKPENINEAEEILREAVRMKDRQTLPDAHLYLGLLLKTKPNGMKEAIRHFRNAVHLNPSSHEAQREVRLYEMRHGEEEEQDDGFLKKLFKK